VIHVTVGTLSYNLEVTTGILDPDDGKALVKNRGYTITRSSLDPQFPLRLPQRRRTYGAWI
jgi:hypothetical protein